MLNHRERTLRAAVEVHGLHGALHALVEVCYRKAALLEAARTNHLKGKLNGNRDSERYRKIVENWKLIGQRLTAVEAEAALLEF